jgi:ADP-ribosylglycohydrolase
MDDTLPTDRLARARLALDGLSVGDALGGFYEFSSGTSRRIEQRIVPGGVWHWTDDTAMALAVVATLETTGGIDQNVLAQQLVARFDRGRGYGLATRALLNLYRRGRSWPVEAPALFGGRGSWGNGATSRVAPIGAYFADDLERAAEHAARSAVVTHAHPEAQAGAIAVAVATALAAQSREQAVLAGSALLEMLIAHVPPSLVRDRLQRAQQLPSEITVAVVAQQLGNGMRVSAQDSVPFALWCAVKHLDNYEQAIRLALGGGGDCDTICAIVGGVVALSARTVPIPPAWLAAREPLLLSQHADHRK